MSTLSPVSNEELAKKYLELGKRAQAKDFRACKELVEVSKSIIERFIFEYAPKDKT